MKKILVIALFLSSFSLLATEVGNTSVVKSSEKVFLSYCSHFGDGVSFSFSSCVNSNFRQLQGQLGNYYSYCSNFGDEVSYSYTSCIQNNFRNAERSSNGALYLSYCSNFDRERLSFSYVSCVNNNFRSIENYLRRSGN